MANLIKLKRSAVPGKTPTVADLELGELAINTNDGKLFFEKDNGTASVVQVANAGINSDITELTGVTGGISSPHYIQFALDPSVAPAEGRLWYNPEDDTLNVGMSGGVVQQVGQEFFMPPCKNNSGVVINNGDFIMATGVSGDKVTIAKAVTDGTIAPEYMIGVATQQITADSEVGMVCTNGIVRGIDTSAWAVGTILYPNPAVAGGLTSTKPSAPNIKTPIAIVLRQHASTGRILVRMSTGSVLGGTDSNVEFTALSNADLVVYNSTNSRWENKSLVNVLGYTPANKAGDTFTGQVNFDGNVGIGTSSPTTKLDIYGGAGNGRIQASVASVNPSLDLVADSTNGYFPAISFSGVGGGFGSFTGFAGTGMFYNFNSHVFRNASNVEYARINSSGNVGIGTSSPVEKLDVRGGTGNGSVSIHVASSNAAINLRSDATNGYYPTINLYGANASGGLVGKLMGYDGVYLDAAGNRSVVLRTNSSERLRVNGSGYVGIGTSSPANIVDIVHNQNAVSLARITNTDVGASARARLIVSNGTTQGGFSIMGTGASAPGDISIFNNSATAALVFAVGSGVERMRITSAGNVGIGDVTSPGYKLTVNGSIASTNATAGLGYGLGAGGTVTQATSRTTGVTLNTVTGSITLVSAAGTTAWQSFTVTNSVVAADDVVIVNQRSGTDPYLIHVTNVAAGSFQITFATTGGTTTEQPVFNFVVIKGSTS